MNLPSFARKLGGFESISGLSNASLSTPAYLGALILLSSNYASFALEAIARPACTIYIVFNPAFTPIRLPLAANYAATYPGCDRSAFL
jgi:hypothetical protein